MRHGYGARTSAPFGLASHRSANADEDAGRGTAAAAPAVPPASGPAASLAISGGGGLSGALGGAGAAVSGVRRKLGAIARGSQSSLSGEAGGGAQPPLARRAVDAEGARGGFVLRSKSDDVPHRRRSLVERTGMKTFVQVRPT